MSEWLDPLQDFFNSMSADHNVDPLIFGILYLGTIPLYLLCLAWTVRNLRTGKTAVLPLFGTITFFFLPAFYIALFGKNVAWYVYLILILVVIYGGFNLRKKMRNKLQNTV